MMKNITHNVKQYPIKSEDLFLLDANIWLDILGHQTGPRPFRVEVYSAFFKAVINMGATIVLDTLVLSEFINRSARIKHRILIKTGNAPEDYKQFRSTPAFLPVAQEIADDLRIILRHCHRIESGFSEVDMTQLLQDYEARPADFNDLMLCELCRANGYTLVTHDGDFKDRGLKVISFNSFLLN